MVKLNSEMEMFGKFLREKFLGYKGFNPEGDPGYEQGYYRALVDVIEVLGKDVLLPSTRDLYSFIYSRVKPEKKMNEADKPPISLTEYDQLLRVVETAKKHKQLNSAFGGRNSYSEADRRNAEMDLVEALADWERNINRLCDRR